MDEITPVFVCGMGRSGTTNALRVLNTHPDIALNGEIALSVLKQLFAFLEGLDRSYEGKENLAGWRSRKAAYMFESFGYLAKTERERPEKIAAVRFRGHKSPRLEALFEKYEEHFGSLGSPPRYFYCARNPFDCWRSYREMPWSNYANVEKFLRHYKMSFSRLKQMQDAASGRVTVLNLDDLIAAPDLLAFYRENIFRPLGLELPERSILRIERIEDNSQRAARPDLSTEDRAAIENYPGIAEILAAHFPRATSMPR